MNFLQHFLANAGLIFAVCFVQQFVLERCPKATLRRQGLSGVVFGLAAIAAMSVAVEIQDGVIFDGRTVPLAVGSLFAGPVSGAVAAVMAAAYRLYLGGSGVPVGLLVIATASILGIVFRLRYRDRLSDLGALHFLGFGIAVHLAAMLLFLALPLDFGRPAVTALFAFFLGILSVATMIVGLLLREIERGSLYDQALRKSRDRFQALFEKTAVPMLEEDVAAVVKHLDRLRAKGVGDLRDHLRKDPAAAGKIAGMVRIRHANSAALGFFGVPDDNEIRNNIGRFFAPDTIGTFTDLLCAMWNGETDFSQETSFVDTDGRTRRVIISVPLPRTIEDARRLPVTIVDVTDLRRVEEEAAQLKTDLGEAAFSAIGAIAATIEQRDPYTSGHQANVARLAVKIAGELGWDADRIEGLRLGAMIHDIGKISVPSEILNRPGRLTDVEFEIIKAHPTTGYEILKGTSFPWPIRDMIVQHHERLDGSGYPAGLTGDDIIPEARVIAVADVIDAMTSHRPYRPGLGIEAALAEVEAHKGTFYEASVVEAAAHLIRDKGFRWSEARPSSPSEPAQ